MSATIERIVPDRAQAQPDTAFMDGDITLQEFAERISDSIETNLWLAEAFASQGADGLASECVRAARAEWERNSRVLLLYCGPKLATEIGVAEEKWLMEGAAGR